MTYQDLKKIGKVSVTFGGKFGITPYGNLSAQEKSDIICFMRDNKAALIAEYESEKTAERDRIAAEQARRDRMVTVVLSSRGWGDYSPCQISIDPEDNLTDNAMLDMARNALANQRDVDIPNQTDDEIMDRINAALGRDAKDSENSGADADQTITDEMGQIESVETTQKESADEGGKTITYTHVVTLKNGTVIALNDRNVFDFGRVINPLYAIADGMDPGGILVTRGGAHSWRKYDANTNRYAEIPLTDDETLAASFVIKYCGHARSTTRM